VIVPFDDVPVTTTQSPTANDEADVVVDWENAVEGTQLTVTWPDC
jgi:hypothetical protein